jgi:hypothetical protein
VPRQLGGERHLTWVQRPTPQPPGVIRDPQSLRRAVGLAIGKHERYVDAGVRKLLGASEQLLEDTRLAVIGSAVAFANQRKRDKR